MIVLTLKHDTSATGKMRRFTIGKPNEEISGALYIKAGVKIPDAVIMSFPEEMVEDKGEEVAL